MAAQDDNSQRTPILGCIADDVTGATDLAINLVQGGMRVIQMLGVPDLNSLSQTDGFDAIVVALKTRSIPKEQAIDQTLASARVMQQIGDLRFYFKYCSTFDSTADGNIGPVAEALMEHLDVGRTIFCPAFPRAGRTVYRGHLFVGDSLLSESGMENHPLNPMTDANLVRFLSKQTARQVALFGSEMYADPPSTYADKLRCLAENGFPLVVTDVCSDSHLELMAQGIADMRLVTGGSGLARYLPSAYRAIRLLSTDAHVPTLPQITGRSLIVAGSCSAATNAQVTWMKQKCPAWPVDVAAVVNDADSEREKVRAWAATVDPSEPLLIYSTAEPDHVSQMQEQFGRETVASLIEQFLAKVAESLVGELNVRRLVLAGGETSGAIVNELGIHSLSIGPEICVGVPWTESLDGDRPLALALKSGNFGAEDFFQTALELLG